MVRRPFKDLSEREQLECDFERFLFQERGLAESTVLNYLPTVGVFLSEQFGSGKIKLSKICADDVTGFVRTTPTTTAMDVHASWLGHSVPSCATCTVKER
jgi:hypothetical protein